MNLKASSLILTLLLITACGGSGSSGGNQHQPVQLDFYNSDVRKQSISQYFTGERYGPTLDFYHFIDEKAVVLAEFPNDSLEFSMSASIHLFAADATTESIRRWINNQHSDGLHPQAAEPTLTIALTEGEHYRIDSEEFLTRETGSQGDTYDRYDVVYTIESYEHHEVHVVESFEAVTSVAQHINKFSNILNRPLPIHEMFTADSADHFFSRDYFLLRTYTPRFAPSLVDQQAAFYYPLCCREENDELSPDHFAVSNNTLMMSDANFTIGQVLHRFPDEAYPNPKMDTHYPAGNQSSWGELDLSEPYRVSFCVVDAGSRTPAAGRFGIWVNNNAGDSIYDFGSASRLVLTQTENLNAGERFTINVPGDIFNSNTQTGTAIGEITTHKGNGKSFLQLRADDGGYLVISDLIIESQTQDNASGLTCTSTPAELASD